VTKSRNPHLLSEAGVDYAELVRAAASGDRPAMERLLMRAQEVAFRFSLLVCGDPHDAEDVMQDALLRTYRQVHRIRRPEAFRTWLFRTVRNACLMKRRRRVDEPAHVASLSEPSRGDGGDAASPVDMADTGKSPEAAAIDGWLGGKLRRALARLPPTYRVIVLLREMEGLSTREVAKVTGLSEANVKTRLHRARVMLREALESM
jgi:RNA polymerase sigma-70 factor (ECF subfamily)